MVFLNGAEFSDTSGDWNRQRSSANTTSNFAYGEDLLVGTGTLTYYLNDVLIYTSEMGNADLYPLTLMYEDNSSVTINSDYVATKQIDFTIIDWATTAINVTGFGLNDDVSSQMGWGGFNAQFTVDKQGLTNYYGIREGGIVKLSNTAFTPANGDKFTLKWAAAPSETRFPPPPITVRF